jgi:dipeptidyl aminopeptidase/acylaminoacyl peptidase
MRVERVELFSNGCRLVGQLKLPDTVPEWSLPAIVQGPGWLADLASPDTLAYQDGFVAAGFALLSFDYRGFGQSDGERGWVRWRDQVDDIRNALTYLETRPELDPDRLGVFGSGGTGGGNAIYVAALDQRVKACVAMTAVADGRDWFRRQRREYEWVELNARVGANRQRVARGGDGELVDPREELMVATPERRQARRGPSNESVIGERFQLCSADSLLQYRPVEVVDRISPRALLLTSVEDDVVTPEDHAVALFERAGSPKKLIRQAGVKHYESYHRNLELLLPQFVDWYRAHLRHSPIIARSAT